jgi:hypothetical protein
MKAGVLISPLEVFIIPLLDLFSFAFIVKLNLLSMTIFSNLINSFL